MNDEHKKDTGIIISLMILMKINPNEKSTFIKGMIAGFIYCLLFLFFYKVLDIWLIDMKNALGL